MLHLTGFKKAYHNRPVIGIGDLVLERGVYWLRGENGAGKTTLLKCLAGLLPFDGEIKLGQYSIRTNRREYTRQVSYAEAEPQFPPFLTGEEVFYFFRQAKGSDANVDRRLLNGFAMESYLHQKIQTYSSGMVKKLALVLAFTGSPKLILLDEPFTTLDSQAVAVLCFAIEEGFRNGISFLISSHQPLSLSVPLQTVVVQNQTLEIQPYAERLV